jgi:hypothetical protein
MKAKKFHCHLFEKEVSEDKECYECNTSTKNLRICDQWKETTKTKES